MKVIRKYIPIAVRVDVAERQMMQATGCVCTNEHGVPLREAGASLSLRLEGALFHLSEHGKKKLELHHRPALENRPLNRAKTDHVPPANDPDHLVYLLKGEEHKIETYVRGVRGQLSDAGLRRKNKRMAANRAPKKRGRKVSKLKRRIAGRALSTFGVKVRRKWPSRPFGKGRKLRWKR